MVSTRWSIDPLLHASLPNEVFESAFTDKSLFLCAFLSSVALSITYSIAHQILTKYSREYVALESRTKQLVVVHHATEALVLSVVFPIFSYFMIKTNFQIQEDLDDVITYLTSIITCMYAFMAMYMFELASRFDEPRPIVVFHHLLSCFDGVLVIVFPTSIMCRTASVLGYFISFEALTFAGLFMYRIFPQSKLTPKVILAGMMTFGLSRPFQLLWVGASIFGSWNDEYTVKWQALMQIVVTCILTCLQLMTLKIHYGTWIRCIAKKRIAPLDKTARMVDLESPQINLNVNSGKE